MKNKSSGLYKFYYLLAGVDLLMLIITLSLNHKNIQIFKDSLALNQDYVNLLTTAEDLTKSAALANAPGNNIFDTLDVQKERENFSTYEKDFRLKLESTKELITEKKLSSLENNIHQIEGKFDGMKAEAQGIFTAFSQQKVKYAASRMATMDQKFALLNDELAALRKNLNQSQSDRILQHTEQVNRLSFFEKIIGLVVVVMLVAITLFGRFMSKQWLEKNTQIQDRESQILEAQKMASLGTMLSAIIHEIQNPLTIISGKVNLMDRKLKSQNFKPEELLKDNETILKMTQRIHAIAQGVRSLSHGGSSDQNFEEVDFSTILEEVGALTLAKAKGLGVSLAIQKIETIKIECQPVPLSQVLINLINNACDAIQNSTEKWVQVNIVTTPATLQISVTDSGAGLPAEIAEKIMSPFFTTKDRGKGTGLGLSICKKIIESHHGKFFYNKESPNTQFVFVVPLTQPKAETLDSSIKKAA
jgi:signal transduction histidine kinase